MNAMYPARACGFWLIAVSAFASSPGVMAAVETSGPALDLPKATIALGDDEPAKGGTAPAEQLLDAARKAVLARAVEPGVDSQDMLIADTVHAGNYGPDIVTFRQVAELTEVFGARITAALDGGANVRAITGGFSPHVKTLGETGFKLDAQSAIQALINNSGISDEKAELKALKPHERSEFPIEMRRTHRHVIAIGDVTQRERIQRQLGRVRKAANAMIVGVVRIAGRSCRRQRVPRNVIIQVVIRSKGVGAGERRGTGRRIPVRFPHVEHSPDCRPHASRKGWRYAPR